MQGSSSLDYMFFLLVTVSYIVFAVAVHDVGVCGGAGIVLVVLDNILFLSFYIKILVPLRLLENPVPFPANNLIPLQC